MKGKINNLLAFNKWKTIKLRDATNTKSARMEMVTFSALQNIPVFSINNFRNVAN